MPTAEVRAARGSSAAWMIALAGALVASGGVLLGLQIDRNGAWSGTGFTTLAIGALVALSALLVRGALAGRMPRDGLGGFTTVTGFFGLSFVIAGVLAPGGPWMFCEVLVLLFFVARRRARPEDALDRASVVVLGLMLLFRLWISYQGSENRWQLMSIGIPVLSWIPLALLEPIQRVSLGSFTPAEFGFPPAGLDFPPSLALWMAGFSACAIGLLLLQSAAHEHENDRIHAVIHTLPAPVAALVERLLPEEQWCELGLHALSERRMCKRIEALVAERMAHQREIQAAWQASALLGMTRTEGFSGDIHRALSSANTIDVERAQATERTGNA